MSLKQIIDDTGVNRVPLPPRSPYLNAFAERWVRSVKEEALSRMILFGERSLWHVLNQYISHAQFIAHVQGVRLNHAIFASEEVIVLGWGCKVDKSVFGKATMLQPSCSQHPPASLATTHG